MSVTAVGSRRFPSKKRVASEGNLKRKRISVNERASQTLDVGTWEWDIEQDCVRCCEVTAGLFGLDPASASQMPIEKFYNAIDEGDQALVRRRVQEALEHGGAFVAEYRTRSGPEHRQHVLAFGRFFKTVDGQASRAKGVTLKLGDTGEQHPEPALFFSRIPTTPAEALQIMADQVISAWEVGQSLPPEMFKELKPALQTLLFALGVGMASGLQAAGGSGSSDKLH